MGDREQETDRDQQANDQAQEVAQQGMSTDDDYQTELPQGSTSAAAAQAGDEAVIEAQGQPSPFRLPPMHFSSEHARQKQEELQAKADAYNLSWRGKGTNRAAYRDMVAQAEAYSVDAQNLDDANVAYNELVPQSAFAYDSVVRFKAIQAELGIDFSDNDQWTVTSDDLTQHLGDRKSELARGISAGDIKTNKGQVSDAARDFTTAQSNLYAALAGVQSFKMQQVVRKLEAERDEQQEQKEQIDRAIESAHSVTEFVSSALGTAGDGYFGLDKATKGEGEHDEHSESVTAPHADVMEKREGVVDVAKSADELGGVALGLAMHAIHDEELAQIETSLQSFNTEIQSVLKGKEAQDVAAIYGTFKTAKQQYISARHKYEDAIASRRTAYAKAGATADRMHAHGGSIRHGKDRASQTMLFISAARETDVILRTALPTGEHADEVLHRTLVGLRHRSQGYLVDDWRWGEAEGGNTADRQQAMQAYALVEKWIAGTKTEIESFDPIEKASAEMLRKTGRTAGDY